jgi:CheY-like chemotaxis protein
MVVDDDPLILSSTAAMLEDLGHLVTEASSAVSALQILSADANVDLILTDHAMPTMTGIELMNVVRQNWPWIPVVLASGYADLLETGDAPRHRLAKPFRQAELAVCITTVVGEQKVVAIETDCRS